MHPTIWMRIWGLPRWSVPISLLFSQRWSSQELFLLSDAEDGHPLPTGPHTTATLCGTPRMLMSPGSHCSSWSHLLHLPDEEMVLGVVIHSKPRCRATHAHIFQQTDWSEKWNTSTSTSSSHSVPRLDLAARISKSWMYSFHHGPPSF